MKQLECENNGYSEGKNKMKQILFCFLCILAIPCNSADSNSGTFKDSRDGQEYKWVKIGSQIWMAENLNYKLARFSLLLASAKGTPFSQSAKILSMPRASPLDSPITMPRASPRASPSFPAYSIVFS